MEIKSECLKVTSDVEADNLISEIRELESDKARFGMIYKARNEQLKTDLDRRTDNINKTIEFDKGMLQAYFLTVKPKETKTMSKYKLLSGSLVMKKSTKKIEIADKEILMQYARTSAAEYIKVKEDIDWASMKKVLDIDGTNVVNTETGEILEDNGLKIVNVSEIFDIKI